MRNDVTRKNTLVLAGIFVVAMLVYGIGYGYIINPLQQKTSVLNQEVSMYETQYERLVEQQNDVPKDEKLEEVAVKVPSQKLPDNILTNLQETADDADVTITHIGAGTSSENTETSSDDSDEQQTDVINSHSYTLNATAENLADMNTFLDNLLKSERLFLIDTLSISQSAEVIDLIITFRAFSSS